MVVMLRQCCCGCTLKTGAIILGVLNALGGLANLIYGITAAAVADSVFDSDTQDMLRAIGIAEAVFGGIMLVVALCLVVGAVQGNPVLLLPWLVFTVVFLIANTVLYIVIAAQYFDAGYGAQGAGNIVGAIIYILLEIYFILVVYSLYRELKGTAPPNNA